MDFIYYISKDFVHYSALLLLVSLIPALIISLAKPSLIPKSIRVFGGRKNTLIGSFMSVIVLVGLVSLTGPSGFETLNISKNPADSQPANQQMTDGIPATGKKPIEKKLQRKTVAVKFETQEKSSKSLSAGQKRTVQKGQNGKKVLTYEVNYKDGQEVSRELKSSSMIEEPVTRIMLVSSHKSPKNENNNREESGKNKESCELAFWLPRSDKNSKHCSFFNN